MKTIIRNILISIPIFLFSFSSIASAGTPEFEVVIDSVTGEFFYDDVQSGDSFTESVRVSLPGEVVSSDFNFKFSSFDNKIFAKTGNNDSPLNMENWITFPEGNTLNVGADGLNFATLPIQFTVPENAAPGDYQGLMQVSYMKPSQAGGGGAAGASFTSAIGFRVSFSVPGERVHKVSLDNFEYVGHDLDEFDQLVTSSLGFDVLLSSEGNTVVVPDLDLTLTNAMGKKLYNGKIPSAKVFPGSTFEQRFFATDVEDMIGWVDAELKVAYSPVSITQKKDVAQEDQLFDVTTKTLRIYFIPWHIVIPVVVIILLVVMILLWRFFALARLKKKCKVYTVQEGDTLQTVSTKFSVDPNLLIKVNKLKKPYILMTNTKLLIPVK